MDTPTNKGEPAPPVRFNEALLNEAEALIWALLDDDIKVDDIKHLKGLIREHEQVRQRYLTCVQMHTDLQEHFTPNEIMENIAKLPKSPVLGSLGNLTPGTGSMPPVIE